MFPTIAVDLLMIFVFLASSLVVFVLVVRVVGITRGEKRLPTRTRLPSAEEWQLLWLRDDYAKGRISIEELHIETEKILRRKILLNERRKKILEVLPPK